jgi:hypothetical protein
VRHCGVHHQSQNHFRLQLRQFHPSTAGAVPRQLATLGLKTFRSCPCEPVAPYREESMILMHVQVVLQTHGIGHAFERLPQEVRRGDDGQMYYKRKVGINLCGSARFLVGFSLIV